MHWRSCHSRLTLGKGPGLGLRVDDRNAETLVDSISWGKQMGIRWANKRERNKEDWNVWERKDKMNAHVLGSER
jgi:hypothetical protein